MNRVVFWRSWSAGECALELERIKGLPLKRLWVDGHKFPNPTPDDIWMTTNGYDYKPGLFRRASWYAESYNYLRGEYDRYNQDTRFNHRFHFNPNFCKQPNTSFLPIMCWWRQEKELFDKLIKSKPIKYQFGMVLSKKPDLKIYPGDCGQLRTAVVNAARGHSFRYYGCKWDKNDPNYGGEIYVNGTRNTPIKFNDARILMGECKFVFCLENICDQFYSWNYLTEKIFHGFLSASIPIYYGCFNIKDLIDPSLFINLRDFNMDIGKCMNYCEKISETEYKGYQERIGKWLEGEGQKFTCENRFLELDEKLSQVFK
jgi:hypothetical protein